MQLDAGGLGSNPHGNDFFGDFFGILSTMDASSHWSDIICALVGLRANKLYPFSISSFQNCLLEEK